MAHAGTIAGYNGSISFTGNLSGDAVEYNCRSWTLDWTADMLDVSTFDTTTGPRIFIGGLTSWSGSFEVLVDKDTALNSTFVTTTTTATAKFDVSDVSGGMEFTGSIILTGVSVNVSVDGLPVASCTFQGDGTLAIAAAS